MRVVLEKIPDDDEVKVTISGDLKAWRDFLAHRLPQEVDVKSDAGSLQMYRALKAAFPDSFQDFDSSVKITVERLIERALHRHDVEELTTHLTRARTSQKFVDEVRKILVKGLSTLQDDPWEDAET